MTIRHTQAVHTQAVHTQVAHPQRLAFATRWLALACLVLAAMIGIETWGFARTGIIEGALQIGLCTACSICALALPVRPVVLAWPLLVAALLLDVLRITSPSGVFLAVMLAIVILAYRSPVLGMLAASLPFAAALYVTLQEGGYPIWIFSSIVQYAVWYYSMAFIGHWARKRAEFAALQQRERQRRIREQVLRRLHDAVANDLTYLVAVTEYRTSAVTNQPSRNGADTDVLEDIGTVARNALQETRQAIDVLEEHTDHVDDSHADTLGTGKTAHTNDVAALVDRNDRHLHRLGFRGGSVFNSSGDSDVPADIMALTTAFLRELYGNMLKYAEPTGYYAVAVRIAPDEIVVTASDVPRHSPSTASDTRNSSHSGLRRHSEAITRVGGTCDIECNDAEWRLAARIPFRQQSA